MTSQKTSRSPERQGTMRWRATRTFAAATIHGLRAHGTPHSVEERRVADVVNICDVSLLLEDDLHAFFRSGVACRVQSASPVRVLRVNLCRAHSLRCTEEQTAR